MAAADTIRWGKPYRNRDRYRDRDRNGMVLGHEKLDVYRLSIGYIAWVYEKCANLNGIHRSARDQWLRASQSIPLNIAEGNGKTAKADRRRYFEIARGSALECAAIQDVLVVGKGLSKKESRQRKNELDRIAAMLSTENRNFANGAWNALYNVLIPITCALPLIPCVFSRRVIAIFGT